MKLHPMQDFGAMFGQIERIRVNRLEKRHIPMVPFPHKHNFFHLVIVTKGKGWHEIDFKRHPVSAKSIFFMKPGQVHSWSLGKGTSGYVIEFEQAAVHSRSGLEFPDYFAPAPKLKKQIEALCQSMLEEYEEQSKDFEEVLTLKLATLLLIFARDHSVLNKISEPAETSLPNRFSELVEQHFRESHQVEFYALKLKTTPKLLTMRLKRATGKAPRQIIQERCLLEATRLLAYSKHSINEVGFKVGFEDPNYFARFFHEKAGLSPKQFRDKAKSI